MDHQFISLSDSFQHDIFGQPRTSRYKQYLILKPNWVYKGPYTKERLDRLLDRTNWFKIWKTPHMVLPLEIIKVEDENFARFPNLITNFSTNLKSHWNTESFTGNRYRVIDRTDLVKFNQGLPAESWIYQEHGETMLLALVHLWILGVGDTGIYNMLMKRSTREVYVIDFDESSNKIRDNPEFYFSRPSGKKYGWYSQMKPYYLSVAEKVRNMICSEPYSDRIKLATDLLIKYGSEQIGLEIQPIIESEQIILNIQPSNLGKMVWSGLFNGTKTFHGCPLDVAKSLLQKAIRRGHMELALKAGFELWRLAEVGGISGQTNMYNRLAVIAAEDVGPVNLNLILYVINYALNDVKTKKDRSASKLAVLIQQLTISRKTRLMSHIWRVYTNSTGRQLAEKMGIQIDSEVIDLNLINDSELDRFFHPSDPVELIPYAKMFYQRLIKRDFNAVWWIHLYWEKFEKVKTFKVKSRCRRTKPMIIIWEMMRDFLDSNIIDVLSRAYFTFSEKRPYLMAAITTILYSSNEVNKLNPVKAESIDLIINHSIKIWTNHPYLAKLINSEYELEIPEYAIDMHTKQGRLKGKNRTDFVREGAAVNNQDSKYYDSRLESIYNQN